MTFSSGLKFPLQLSSSGSFEVVSGAEKMKSNIEMVLSTDIRERLLNPLFGTSIKNRLFRNMDASSIAGLKLQIKTGIETSEPRVSVLDVIVNEIQTDGVLDIVVQFRINGSEDIQDVSIFIKD